MKITRKVPEPQPTLVTLEITLDELIALKTFAEYYATAAAAATTAGQLTLRIGDPATTAAGRFAESIAEKSYSWRDTDKLFR